MKQKCFTWLVIACLLFGSVPVSAAYDQTHENQWSQFPVQKQNGSQRTYEATYAVQKILRYYSDEYGNNYYKSSLDGSFGSGTLKAVKSYQEYWGLTPDGSVGPNTWRTMYRDSSLFTPDSTSTAYYYGTYTTYPNKVSIIRYNYNTKSWQVALEDGGWMSFEWY